jgi:hypothetical protein
MVQAKVTPHTSPTKDANLCGLPVEDQEQGDGALGMIRQLAAQNGGLPDVAIVDESSCSSLLVDRRGHRAFSFADGDDRIVSRAEDASIAMTFTNIASIGSNSREVQQLAPAHKQSLGSQIDGAPLFSNEASSNAPGHQKSSPSSSSSGTSQHRSHTSVLRSMGHNHATEANKREAATHELRKLQGYSSCSPMIIAIARERSVPSPSKKIPVHEDQVPGEKHASQGENVYQPQSCAFVSDEELAVISNRRAAGQRARGRVQAGHDSLDQELSEPSAMANQTSTSGENDRNEPRSQAA